MNLERSVDAAEVSAFNRLAETWWDAAGPMWPLHRLNRLRRDYLAERLRAFFPGRPVDRPLANVRTLDIGCAAGLLSEAAAKLGAQVHGVDVAERNIAIAREHARETGLDVRYEVGTAEKLHDRGEQYDLVLNMEVVEHVADLEAFLAACSGLTRPGGVMVISTINRTIISFLAAIIGAEYVLRWLPRGTHQWSRFPRPAELETILHKHQIKVVDRVGVGVNPFNRRFSIRDYLGINYMLITEKAK